MVPEAKKKIKLYMGVPSNGDRVDAQNYYLRRMEKQYGDRIEFVYPEIFVGRIFHDFARNQYVEQFLESDCDILWFLDSDIVPAERTLDLITEHGDKWQLAGAPYPVWMSQPGFDGPQVTFTVYKESNGGLAPAAIPNGGIEFVGGVATGCLFIKREVLLKMKKPYFEFKYHAETREICEGEDLGFCLKANALGYKFFIDYSMLCHHFKRISLLDVSNFLELQKQIVIDECDKMIRQIVAKKELQRLNKPRVEPVKSRLILP